MPFDMTTRPRNTADNRRRRAALFMTELRHQQLMGEGFVQFERDLKTFKVLPLHNNRQIVIDGEIPARIMAFDRNYVVLDIGGKHFTLRTHWIAGRFRYGREELNAY